MRRPKTRSGVNRVRSFPPSLTIVGTKLTLLPAARWARLQARISALSVMIVMVGSEGGIGLCLLSPRST